MTQDNRNALAVGLVLIALGALFLIGQFVPGWELWTGLFGWPLIVVGVGVALLVVGLLTGAPGMAVPACIVGGIGLLLYWQNATGNWESWAYAWTLIAGFAGIGTMVSGLLSGNRKAITGGATSVLISLVMFVIFASFLGGPNLVGSYWPVLLIVLGVILLLRSLFERVKGDV